MRLTYRYVVAAALLGICGLEFYTGMRYEREQERISPTPVGVILLNQCASVRGALVVYKGKDISWTQFTEAPLYSYRQLLSSAEHGTMLMIPCGSRSEITALRK